MSWKGFSITKCAQTAQRVVETLEPWGVLIAIVALVFTLYEFRLERNVREATLLVMVAERLEAARAADKDERNMSAPGEYIEPFARVGQIPALEEVVRSKLSLRNMDLSEIDLSGARLQGANLSDAILTCSILAETTLAHSNLRGAISQGVKFYGATLFDADFTDADLVQARFSGGTLEHADFTSANLWAARFWKVELRGANFTAAQFQNTRFEDVDLSQVEGLTQDQMSRACGEKVVLPSGYSIEPCNTEPPRHIEICEFRFTNKGS